MFVILHDAADLISLDCGNPLFQPFSWRFIKNAHLPENRQNCCINIISSSLLFSIKIYIFTLFTVITKLIFFFISRPECFSIILYFKNILNHCLTFSIIVWLNNHQILKFIKLKIILVISNKRSDAFII